MNQKFRNEQDEMAELVRQALINPEWRTIGEVSNDGLVGLLYCRSPAFFNLPVPFNISCVDSTFIEQERDMYRVTYVNVAEVYTHPNFKITFYDKLVLDHRPIPEIRSTTFDPKQEFIPVYRGKKWLI